LLITTVANSLRYADDIVSTAEARAFSTTRVRPTPVQRQPGDLPLAGVLALLALALLV